MEYFVLYITKSVICISILYLIYWIFLRKETFFSVNRYYLIASIFLSLIIPALNFTIDTTTGPVSYNYVLNSITITSETLLTSYTQNLSLIQTILIIYLTGAFLFMIRFVFQIYQISRLIKRFGITNKEGLHIVFTDANYAPFSFFNLLFLNKNIQTVDAEKIIAHEQIHVRQHHTIDIIILEILTIIQWFNPVAWLYRYSLQEVHEYLADEGVLLKGYEKINYQQLLLSMTMGVQVNDLTNNFNNSLIKRRFIMMTKMKSTLLSRFKILLVVPFIAVYIMIFSCSNKEKADSSSSDKGLNTEQNSSKNITATNEVEKVYETAENIPEFKGGQEAMVKFLIDNVKYPENAKKNKKEGKVYVSFIVDRSGKVKDAKIIKSVDPELDAEAVRSVSSMPDWNPGKDNGKTVSVSLTLPIQFKLE